MNPHIGFWIGFGSTSLALGLINCLCDNAHAACVSAGCVITTGIAILVHIWLI
jgi:hypothetical protein